MIQAPPSKPEILLVWQCILKQWMSREEPWSMMSCTQLKSLLTTTIGVFFPPNILIMLLTIWSIPFPSPYAQVVLPLHQLKAVNPSASKAKPGEKYVQLISVDNHEFWFMGFVHYDSAVKNLQGVLQNRSLWCVNNQVPNPYPKVASGNASW